MTNQKLLGASPRDCDPIAESFVARYQPPCVNKPYEHRLESEYLRFQASGLGEVFPFAWWLAAKGIGHIRRR